MATKLSIDVRRMFLDGVISCVGNGYLEIYSGTQPASADDDPTDRDDV